MRVTKHATLRMGLIFVPIGVCTSASRKDITFNGLHVGCGGRVGIASVCKECQKALGPDDIQKGYEVSKGQWVTFSETEIAAFKPEREAVIDITKFVRREEVEAPMVEKLYWLQPEPPLDAPYMLLSQGLMDSNMVAIGRTTLWGKEHPFAIDVDSGVLCMKLLFCFDELVSSSEIRAALSFDVDAEHRDLIRQVIELKAGTIETDDLSNLTREQGFALIAAKAEGKTLAPSTEPTPPPTPDLMGALKAMVK